MALGSCSIESENVFGPVVHGCLSNFDFTLLFEETILFIPPLAITLCLVAARIPHLVNKRKKVVVRGKSFGGLKVTMYLLLCLNQIVMLILICVLNIPRTRATLAATAIGIFGPLVLACFSWLDHYRTLRPSSLLSLYLLASLPMNIVRSRTLWYVQDNRAPAIVFSVFPALSACTLVLELKGKRLLSDAQDKDAPTSEEKAGILERWFFTWLLPVFRLGYRSRLSADNMIPMDRALRDGKPMKQDDISSTNIIPSLLSLYWYEFLAPVFPRICLIGVTLAQPFLVQEATEWLSSDTGADRSYAVGGGLIAAYFLVYVGVAISSSAFRQKAVHLVMVVRSTLVVSIYRHSLNLSTSGTSIGSSTTLMSTDVQQVQVGLRNMHEIWASIITTAIAYWLAAERLGISIVPVVCLSIACIILTLVLAILGGQSQKSWLRAAESRISLVNHVLAGIKSVKMIGCRQVLYNALAKARRNEIDVSRGFRVFRALAFTSGYISVTMAPALGLGVHAVLAQHTPGPLLNTGRAFAALTFLNIATTSLSLGIESIFDLLVAVSCLQRMQALFSNHRHIDTRDHNLSLEPGMDEKGLLSSKPSLEPKGPSEQVNSIKLHELSLLDPGGHQPILRDVNMRIPSGQLTVIFAANGSGKSTLLQTILGEKHPSKGRVTTMGESVGFCDQSAWVLNDTIRANIIGPSRFDPNLYSESLRACELERDLSELSSGDQTVCGSNGLTLSGGQKSRLALARLLYAQPQLAILDDCLSGLDVETEQKVLRNLFGQKVLRNLFGQKVLRNLFGQRGMLRCRRATTVMTTSSSRHLSWAEHIVLLSKDGSVTFEGSYEQLARSSIRLSEESLQETSVIEKQESILPELGRVEPSSLHAAAATAGNTAEEHEEEGQSGSSKIWRQILRIGGRHRFAIFLFTSAVFVFGTIYPQIYLQEWVSFNALTQRDRLTALLAIYFCIGTLGWVSLGFACIYYLLVIAPRVSMGFHELLLNSMLDAPLSFFASTDHGTTVNRFSQDLEMVDHDVSAALIGAVIALLQLVGQGVVIIVGFHYAGIAIPVLFLAVYFIQRTYLRTSRQLRRLDLELKAPLFSHFIESLGGLATIRAFGWTEDWVKRGVTAMQGSQQPLYLLLSGQNMLNLVLDLVIAALAVVIISVAVATRSTTAPGLALALSSIVSLGQVAKNVILAWTTLEVSLGAVERICDFARDTPSEEASDCPELPSDWPSAGGVRFENISVGYSPYLPCVLRGFSLDIEAGSKVAICGRSGSGKSTLISALLRLLDVQAGSITVDGLDITNLSPQAVRSRFTILPQDAFLLDASLRENAGVSGTHSDEAIVAAMQKFGLWETFAHKEGLNTMVHPNFMSQGERQLLAFALRTLCRQGLLILDEPSSYGDETVQTMIQSAFFEEFAQCTILCVAHRLDTILDFDTVVLMDQGTIVEMGQPRELLQDRREGAFAKLYNTRHHSSESK